MSSSTSIPSLDHLILLVPSSASKSLPLATSIFSSLGFTVKQGGTHEDGLTSNILIVLNDGVYLELISFEEEDLKSDKRLSHWWGRKDAGWIDFCLLGYPTKDNEIGKQYQDGIKGGRQTKDGKKLKWEVTFPKLDEEVGEKRGAKPFFCQDVDGTQRDWRAPPPTPPHQNQSTGVISLTFLHSRGTFSKHFQFLSTLLSQPSSSPSALKLSTPSSSTNIELKFFEASTSEHTTWIEGHGEGVWEVEVGVGEQRAKEIGRGKKGDSWIEKSVEKAGYGRLRLTVV